MEQTPLTEYARYFPDYHPSCFQQDLIEQTVTDLAKWRETCRYWSGNGYRPGSILKMLDYYDELKAQHQKSHVGKYDETAPSSFVEEPPCEFCGKVFCLQLHREAA